MFDFERVRPGDRFSAVMILNEARKRVEADKRIVSFDREVIDNFLHRATHHIRLQSTTADVWELVEIIQ